MCKYKELTKLRMIEVTGGGCAQCYEALPDARNVANILGIEFVSKVAEADENFVIEHNIDRVPTLLLMDGDEEIARCHGYQPEEILEIWVDAMLEKHLGV